MGHDSTTPTYSFQFFDRSGDAAFKAFLWEDFDVPKKTIEAFQTLTKRFSTWRLSPTDPSRPLADLHRVSLPAASFPINGLLTRRPDQAWPTQCGNGDHSLSSGGACPLPAEAAVTASKMGTCTRPPGRPENPSRRAGREPVPVFLTVGDAIGNRSQLSTSGLNGLRFS